MSKNRLKQINSEIEKHETILFQLRRERNSFENVLNNPKVRKVFVLTENHLKLMKEFSVDWQDVEFGAPEIDPKRPYGSSSVTEDMIELLGWKKETKIVMGSKEYKYDEESDDFEGELPDEVEDVLIKLHRELQYALQVVLFNQKFEAGTYVRDNEYSSEWRKMKEAKQNG